MEMQEITNFEYLSKYVAFDEKYEFLLCPFKFVLSAKVHGDAGNYKF